MTVDPPAVLYFGRRAERHLKNQKIPYPDSGNIFLKAVPMVDMKRMAPGAVLLRDAVMPVGVIEVDMFSKDVDTPDHPVALSFKELLEEVAQEYGCRLTSFDIGHGTVSFSFDNDELTAEILKVLQSREPVTLDKL